MQMVGIWMPKKDVSLKEAWPCLILSRGSTTFSYAPSRIFEQKYYDELYKHLPDNHRLSVHKELCEWQT